MLAIRTLPLSLIAAHIVLAGPASTQTLIKNINTDVSPLAVDGDPDFVHALSGALYFSATTPGTGRELWTTDLTEAGTSLVVDLAPGPDSGSPKYLTEMPDGTVLFVGTSPANGTELWTTDGTAAGTELLVDIWPGPESADPFSLEMHAGELYFYATDADHYYPRVWKTDGTAAGTQPVAGIPYGTNGTSRLLSTQLGLFIIENGGQWPSTEFSWRLWLSDGTGTGTALLAEESPEDGFGSEHFLADVVEFDGKLYFGGATNADGNELWVSDGTPGGTGMLADIYPGPEHSDVGQFTEYNGELYFVASDPVAGTEIWKTDGTAVGTVRVTDVVPGNPPGSDLYQGSNVRMAGAFGGFLIFGARTDATGNEVWGTNGDPGNLFLVADFEPGPVGSHPYGLTEFGGLIYCSAFRSDTGRELFATDGTPANTGVVQDIWPGPESSNAYVTGVLEDRILFVAEAPGIGNELWISDGTSVGTTLLKDISSAGVDLSSNPFLRLSIPDVGFFNPIATGSDRPSWVTDGTPAGTEMLLDSTHEFEARLVWGDRVFGTGFTPETGTELWASDGTAAGTGLLVDILPGAASSSPNLMGAYNGELYLGAANGLWATDGTAEGTRLVSAVEPNIGGLTIHKGLAYFSVYTSEFGSEPWVTDGTDAGTQLFLDINPGSGWGASEMVSFGDYLYFPGPVYENKELMRTDGTAAGTVVFADINPLGASNPMGLRVIGDRLVFAANDGANGVQLFATDGASVERISDVDPPPFGQGLDTNHWGNTALFGNDSFVFSLYTTETAGQLLLASDGTAAGTQTIATIDPLGIYSTWSLTNSLSLGGSVVFGANDGVFGTELWTSDGTAEGTFRLTDVNPGGANSHPMGARRVGKNIVFSADDGLVGQELHAIPLSATGDWIAEPFGFGCAGSNGVAPRVDASGSANPGDVLDVELTEAAPLAVAILYVGFDYSRSELGGCAIYLDLPHPAFVASTDSTGSLTLPLAVPTLPAFAGIETWWQFAVADPGGAFAGAAALSPALEVIIGF